MQDVSSGSSIDSELGHYLSLSLFVSIKFLISNRLSKKNLLKVFENIFADVNFDDNIDNIDYIHWIQNCNTEHPKTIIGKFTSRFGKENMFVAVRVQQRAELTKNRRLGLWLINTQKPIFINENLTSDNIFFTKKQDLKKTL